MMKFNVSCPNCHSVISVPFIRKLEKQAIKDYDMAEVSAQDKLSSLNWWLNTISFWGLIKWWKKGRRLNWK